MAAGRQLQITKWVETYQAVAELCSFGLIAVIFTCDNRELERQAHSGLSG